MLTVCCVLKSGGQYTPAHVTRLWAQVEQRLDAPHRFACLSDMEVVPIRLPLKRGWPGWWSKLELFRPGLFQDRVLYLDLDVTVVGDLRSLAFYPALFAIMKDPWRPGFNSSVMVWDAGMADHLYTDFDESVMKRLPGDQDWITERMPTARTFVHPLAASYKAHCRFSVPRGTRAVVFHGAPKPWELRKDLVFA